MGKHEQEFPTASERRFVLADKLASKANHRVETNHKVETIESSAFGAPIPIQRKAAADTEVANSADLQDSIKSILADFK
jgi:hypothetical protein